MGPHEFETRTMETCKGFCVVDTCGGQAKYSHGNHPQEDEQERSGDGVHLFFVKKWDMGRGLLGRKMETTSKQRGGIYIRSGEVRIADNFVVIQ